MSQYDIEMAKLKELFIDDHLVLTGNAGASMYITTCIKLYGKEAAADENFEMMLKFYVRYFMSRGSQ